ncbi:hypothetical protein M8C21_001296, partial [Ambrosia artemisiifolia]
FAVENVGKEYGVEDLKKGGISDGDKGKEPVKPASSAAHSSEIPMGQRGVKSFRETLDGSYVGNSSGCSNVAQPKSVVVPANVSTFSELHELALIGRLVDLQTLIRLDRLLMDNGVFNVELLYVGGLSILIRLSDKQKALDLLLNRDVWSSWFSSLDVWMGQVFSYERIAWLKIQGIPLHIASPEVLDMVAGLFGKIIHPSTLCASDRDLSMDRVGVLVGEGVLINEAVNLKWKNRAFKVWVMEELNVWEPDCVGVISDPIISPVPVAGDVVEEETSQEDILLDQLTAQQAAHGVDQSGEGQETVAGDAVEEETSQENVSNVEMELGLEDGEIPASPPDQPDMEGETTALAQVAKEGESTTPLVYPDCNVIHVQPLNLDGVLHGDGDCQHAHEVGAPLDLNNALDINSLKGDSHIDNINYFNNKDNNNNINNYNNDNSGIPVDYSDGVTPIPPSMGKRSRSLRSPPSLGSTQTPPTRACYGDISPGSKSKDINSIDNLPVEPGVENVRSLDIQLQPVEAPGEQPHKGFNALLGGCGEQSSSGKSAAVENHINHQKTGTIYDDEIILINLRSKQLEILSKISSFGNKSLKDPSERSY